MAKLGAVLVLSPMARAVEGGSTMVANAWRTIGPVVGSPPESLNPPVRRVGDAGTHSSGTYGLGLGERKIIMRQLTTTAILSGMIVFGLASVADAKGDSECS